MSIPVYGLSGFDSVDELNDIYSTLGGCRLGACDVRPKHNGKSFNAFAQRIKSPAYKEALTRRNNAEIEALNGVFDVSWQHINTGTATKTDFVNVKKIKILIALNNTDYHAYRIAQVVMPYTIDIDDNGAYYFPTLELAQAAAEGEQKLIDYLNTPGATEIGFEEGLGSFKGFLKKVGKGIANAGKAVGKAIVNSVVVPVKATVQVTKAAFNVTKAGIQAITGNKSAAKESLTKAWEATKASVIDPVKTVYKDTAEVIKTTVVDPTVLAYEITRDITKATIQIAGKVFKVLFLKINPLTVLTRSALRSLLSINFIGLATRLNVGLLTEQQAANLGYDKSTWEQAKKAIYQNGRQCFEVIKKYHQRSKQKTAICKRHTPRHYNKFSHQRRRRSLPWYGAGDTCRPSRFNVYNNYNCVELGKNGNSTQTATRRPEGSRGKTKGSRRKGGRAAQ